MSTTSQSAIVETIRARVKDFSHGGTTIGTLTNSRVYIDWPPDDADFPNVVLRILNWQTDTRYANARAAFDVEFMCFHRGRTASNVRTLKQIADLVEQAMLTWKESSGTLGLSFGRQVDRDTIPPPPEPADRTVMAERVLANCTTWPRFLTDVLTA